MPEGGGHLLQLPRLPLEDVDVLEGNPLHVRAGAITIPPQGDEFRDLLDGEAEVAGARMKPRVATSFPEYTRYPASVRTVLGISPMDS